MDLKTIESLFFKHKESSLSGRYITNNNIEPLLYNLQHKIEIDVLGTSVLNSSIHGIKIGTGKKKVLMWSQMHGNESTTTKALFDLLNTLTDQHSGLEYILNSCTLYIIPILNPDGAKAYTRINANSVDLNRDAQDLSQPESIILQNVFKDFNPHFCYNLHGQRTIFSAGNTNNSATVSFLAPAQDENRSITPNRKIAMEIIGDMNKCLQKTIPNQVGVYDDSFNLNCVGDTFQNKNVPTILFEAGHYKNDYEREETRKLIYISYITSLLYISKNNVSGDFYKSYFKIPENKKSFFDIIIRNMKPSNSDKTLDIGILYQEVLNNNKINFIPKVDTIGDLNNFHGHREIDANNNEVYDENGVKELNAKSENVFVIINNKRISLL